uniref:Uncharacterized protein n=1 Tax=Tetranychus urticae TaxID=32264 RepID=T1KGD9_TETUR
MKFNLKRVIKTIDLSSAEKAFLSANGLNTEVERKSESNGSSIKSLIFLVNISLALINIININYNQTVKINSVNMLVTLREVTYIGLLVAMKMTIVGYNQLIASNQTIITPDQTWNVNKVRSVIITVYLIVNAIRTLKLLIDFHWPDAVDKPSILGSLFLSIHSIWLSDGLLFFSIYLYIAAVYFLHQICVNFKDKVIKTMSNSHRPSTHEISTLRGDRSRYQAIKRFLDETINWWSFIWYIEAFIITCLILISVFHPASTETAHFLNDSWFVYLTRMVCLFTATILVDYVTNFESDITFYIGDHLAPCLDDPVEVKLEYIKLSQELGSRPFIPYTLADMFNLNRNSILSFFSAVLPLTAITLSFIREANNSSKPEST